MDGQTYKDENAFGVSFPTFGLFLVKFVRLGKVDGKQLVRRITIVPLCGV